MKRLLPLLSLALLLLVSCDSSVVFNKTEKFELSWNAKHIVSLTTETISPGKYQTVLVFRYGDGYPFSQLKIHLVATGAETSFTDSDFMVNITDEDGNYIGDGLGDIWDLEQPLDTLTIENPTIIKLQISQKVIDGNLPMVMEVGMKLKKLPE
ncbi:MAG: hypothetical protein DRP35_10030 [Candidatus Zixiibacteriota bacterium]|nr:MAG: hypothetical protein DRP35_10030 [candidate division Zixibacteria bacterium]